MKFILSPFFRLGFLLCLAGALSASTLLAGDEQEFNVLVFSKTAGFRHQSIGEGIAAIRKLGEEHGFNVEATEEAADFNPKNVSRFQAIVFLNTTGTILDQARRDVFIEYIQNGGGFVGVHSAADTEYDWEWYGKLVGAYFKSHPRTQPATIRVEDRSHPATSHLPAEWTRTDEWYNFRANPRENVRTLMSLDTESYEGSAMEGDHPIAWYHLFDGGRAFYTGLGHTSESYAEEAFLAHLLGAIRWAAGKTEEEKTE